MASNRKVTISRSGDADLQTGRRDTLKNRDLGTADATAQGMLSIVTSATQGMGRPSGWHYHPCDHQLIYVLKGWFDLQAEDGCRTRLEEGDAVVIPGRMRHNVPRTADELEVLTVTVPATYEVVECEPPEGFASR